MFEIKDLTEEKVFIFMLCYLYNLNMLHIFKLYELSSTLFKSYLKAFQPMLRLTTNKLITLRVQATRVYDLVTNFREGKKYRDTDLHFAQILNRHVQPIYACNDSFLFISKLLHKCENGVNVMNNDNTLTPISLEEFQANYKNINNIVIDGKVYHKTTPLSFLLCKYFGDRNSREILNMGLADIYKMLESCCDEQEIS